MKNYYFSENDGFLDYKMSTTLLVRKMILLHDLYRIFGTKYWPTYKNGVNDWFQKQIGSDIFPKMLEEYRIQNPSGTSAINDYELLRADKGRCFVDKVKGLDIDAIGMQGTVHFLTFPS